MRHLIELAGLLPSGRAYKGIVKSNWISVTVGDTTYSVGASADGSITASYYIRATHAVPVETAEGN